MFWQLFSMYFISMIQNTVFIHMMINYPKNFVFTNQRHTIREA